MLVSKHTFHNKQYTTRCIISGSVYYFLTGTRALCQRIVIRFRTCLHWQMLRTQTSPYWQFLSEWKTCKFIIFQTNGSYVLAKRFFHFLNNYICTFHRN